jgi:hypothetical protein
VVFRESQNRYEFFGLSPVTTMFWRQREDPAEVAMAAGLRWENYFGNDKERIQKDQERRALEEGVGEVGCWSGPDNLLDRIGQTD